MWLNIQTILKYLGTQNLKILAKPNHVNSMFFVFSFIYQIKTQLKNLNRQYCKEFSNEYLKKQKPKKYGL